MLITVMLALALITAKTRSWRNLHKTRGRRPNNRL